MPMAAIPCPTRQTHRGHRSFPLPIRPMPVRSWPICPWPSSMGLSSAWHHIYTFNRQAPYEVDGSIDFAYEENDIPSYPSDAAVIARVSKTILTAMFPLEAEYLQDLEDE